MKEELKEIFSAMKDGGIPPVYRTQEVSLAKAKDKLGKELYDFLDPKNTEVDEILQKRFWVYVGERSMDTREIMMLVARNFCFESKSVYVVDYAQLALHLDAIKTGNATDDDREMLAAYRNCNHLFIFDFSDMHEDEGFKDRYKEVTVLLRARAESELNTHLQNTSQDLNMYHGWPKSVREYIWFKSHNFIAKGA